MLLIQVVMLLDFESLLQKEQSQTEEPFILFPATEEDI